MDRNQRTFLLIIAALVALFSLVLLVIKANQPPVVPAFSTPTVTTPWTATLTAERTGTPSAAVTRAAPTTEAPAATTTAAATAAATGAPTSTAAVPPSAQQGARAWYITPDGSKEGDGSQEKPWPLQYALDQPNEVQPGDTIWLKGGTYQGSFVCHLNGEKGKEITVRAMPGERVILANDNRVMDIATSSYVNFWGLEITQTQNARDPNDRQETAYGVRINQGETSHDIKFINMIVHDMGAQGFGWWQANSNSEIYGSLIFFNGVTQFDHGIYVHNTDGKKSIIDNIIFDNASHGIHAYGEKDYQELNNLYIEGNTVFNNGSIGYSTTQGSWGGYKRNILVGGLQVAKNPVIINNYTYYPGTSGEALNLGYQAGSQDALVENNYFAGGSIVLGGINTQLKMMQNTIFGFGINPLQILRLGGMNLENNLVFSRPDAAKVFVRPNQYEPGRANITIYNWYKQDHITLTADELKGVQIKKGDTYELHNVQDYFTDVISGTFDGEKIDVPMTNHSVAQPLGLSFKPNTTFPEFGAFVLMTKPAQ